MPAWLGIRQECHHCLCPMSAPRQEAWAEARGAPRAPGTGGDTGGLKVLGAALPSVSSCCAAPWHRVSLSNVGALLAAPSCGRGREGGETRCDFTPWGARAGRHRVRAQQSLCRGCSSRLVQTWPQVWLAGQASRLDVCLAVSPFSCERQAGCGWAGATICSGLHCAESPTSTLWGRGSSGQRSRDQEAEKGPWAGPADGDSGQSCAGQLSPSVPTPSEALLGSAHPRGAPSSGRARAAPFSAGSQVPAALGLGCPGLRLPQSSRAWDDCLGRDPGLPPGSSAPTPSRFPGEQGEKVL